MTRLRATFVLAIATSTVFVACGSSDSTTSNSTDGTGGSSTGAAGSSGAKAAGSAGAKTAGSGGAAAGHAGASAGSAGAPSAGHAGSGGTVAGAAGSGGSAGSVPTAGHGGSAGSPAGSGGAAGAAAGSGGSGGCKVDADCKGALPDTKPPSCAAWACQMDGTCLVASVDADMDGYRTNKCQSTTDGVTVKVGSDCDDTNPNINPKAWDGPAGDGHPDACNMVDDDCSGVADDEALAAGTTCTCMPGAEDPCAAAPNGTPIVFPTGMATGSCKLGSRLCLPNGTYAECTGAVGPEAAEDCSAKGNDDDCDGVLSEDECTCIGGDTQPCGVVCPGSGTQTCNDEGKWGACIGEPQQFGLTCDVDGKHSGSCLAGGKWTCDPTNPTVPKCVAQGVRANEIDHVPVDQDGVTIEGESTVSGNGLWDWNCNGTVDYGAYTQYTPGFDGCGGLTPTQFCDAGNDPEGGADPGSDFAKAFCLGIFTSALPSAKKDATTKFPYSLSVLSTVGCGAHPCDRNDCDEASNGCGGDVTYAWCEYNTTTNKCEVYGASGKGGKAATQTPKGGSSGAPLLCY